MVCTWRPHSGAGSPVIVRPRMLSQTRSAPSSYAQEMHCKHRKIAQEPFKGNSKGNLAVIS